MDKLKKYLVENKKTWITVLCIGIVFLISAVLMYKQEIKTAVTQPRVEMAVKNRPVWTIPSERIPLTEDNVIRQEISMVSTEMTGISVFLEPGNTMNGEITVCLKDDEGTVLEEWNTAAEDIKNEGFYRYYLPETDTVPGEIYIIEVTVQDSDGIPAYLETVNMKNFKDTNILLHEVEVNGVKNAKEQVSMSYEILNGGCDSLVYFFLLIIGLVLVLLAVMGFVISCVKRKEIIFVAVAFLLGLIYIFIIPPYVAPDEGIHFITAYKSSSQIINEEVTDEQGKVILEPESAGYLAREENPNRSTYANYIRGLFGKRSDMINGSTSSRGAMNVSPLGYFPQITGLSLARMFNWNGEWVFVAGRLAALIWYCIIMFWSIRLIPEFAKNILMVVGLMPMTIQLVASYNYDSVLLGTTFFLTAYLLYLAFDDRKKLINVWDYVWIMIALVVIVPLKFVYIPILGIGMMISAEKFGGMKKKVCAASMLLAVAAATFLVTRMGEVADMAEAGSSTGGVAKTYSLTACITDPLHTAVIFWNTVRRNTSNYFSTMIGDGLGWLEISLPDILVFGFAFLFLLSVLQVPSKAKKWNVGSRIWFGVLAGGVAFLVCLALLMSWTSANATVIAGVQGRYFIPAIPLLLLTLQNQVIYLKKDIDTLIIGGVCVLQIMVVMEVISFILAR